MQQFGLHVAVSVRLGLCCSALKRHFHTAPQQVLLVFWLHGKKHKGDPVMSLGTLLDQLILDLRTAVVLCMYIPCTEGMMVDLQMECSSGASKHATQGHTVPLVLQ